MENCKSIMSEILRSEKEVQKTKLFMNLAENFKSWIETKNLTSHNKENCLNGFKTLVTCIENCE